MSAVPPGGIVHLGAPVTRAEQAVTGQVAVRIADEPMAVEVTVPSSPVSLQRMLPLFQGLANAIVDRGEARVEAAGKRVSCRAGCGACCRQPVPIAEPEAHALAALVARMPPPRRAKVRARFAEAVRLLTESGITDRYAAAPSGDDTTAQQISLAYFKLGIACPFLEAESCSIHPDRPIACREYLVVSPPENCATPDGGAIEGVPIAGKTSRAVMALSGSSRRGGWLLLAEALAFVATDAAAPVKRSGVEWAQDGFAKLAGT